MLRALGKPLGVCLDLPALLEREMIWLRDIDALCVQLQRAAQLFRGPAPQFRGLDRSKKLQ